MTKRKSGRSEGLEGRYAVDMYHHNEIIKALRLLVQGASLLAQDSNGTDIVHVASVGLFEAGQLVRLVDDEAAAETHTVMEVLGPGELRLDRAVTGHFAVSRTARLQLVEGAGARLKWVAQGRLELCPSPWWEQLPAVVIEPGVMEQPSNAGTNRTYQQDYFVNLFYVRKMSEGEQANVELLEEAADLFNFAMSDPYLGGTCWQAQVTRVDTRPTEAEGLSARHPGLQVVKMEVLARRSEVWG